MSKTTPFSEEDLVAQGDAAGVQSAQPEAVPSISNRFSTFEDLEIREDAELRPGPIMCLSESDRRLFQPSPVFHGDTMSVYYPQKNTYRRVLSRNNQMQPPITQLCRLTDNWIFGLRVTDTDSGIFTGNAFHYIDDRPYPMVLDGPLNQFKILISAMQAPTQKESLMRRDIAEWAQKVTYVLCQKTAEQYGDFISQFYLNQIVELINVSLYACYYAESNPLIGFEDIDPDTGKRIIRWINTEAIKHMSLEDLRRAYLGQKLVN